MSVQDLTATFQKSVKVIDQSTLWSLSCSGGCVVSARPVWTYRAHKQEITLLTPDQVDPALNVSLPLSPHFLSVFTASSRWALIQITNQKSALCLKNRLTYNVGTYVPISAFSYNQIHIVLRCTFVQTVSFETIKKGFNTVHNVHIVLLSAQTACPTTSSALFSLSLEFN